MSRLHPQGVPGAGGPTATRPAPPPAGRTPLGLSSIHNTTPSSHTTAAGRQPSAYPAPGVGTGKQPIIVNASRKAPPVPVHGAVPAPHAYGPPPPDASASSAGSSARRAVAPPAPVGATHREERRSGSEREHREHREQREHREAAPREHRERERERERERPATRLEREKKKEFSDPSVIGPWLLGSLIGTGASGRVRLARHSKTGIKAAVKIIPRNQLAEGSSGGKGANGPEAQKRLEKMEIGIEREIIVMKLIKHDNLLSLIDVYETKKVLYLIMEYVEGGELFDHLVACGRLEVDQARNYFRQIMFGVDHCHSFNICHRDLKPENLLLSKDKSEVKVADFGMAALQHSGRMLETSCGSPHYASPEIVSGKAYVGTATDIWSCGIILFALLCGKLPFDDPHMHVLLGKVKEGKFDMPKHLKDEAAKDLISKMLVVDPNRRYRMHDIFQHPWFTNYGKLSSRNPVQIVTDNDPVADLPHDLEHDDIFRGLTYLFQGVSKEDLRRQLCDTAPNWPKKFYKLLQRNQAGDDDDLDDDDDLIALASPPPPPQLPLHQQQKVTVSRTPSRSSAHGTARDERMRAAPPPVAKAQPAAPAPARAAAAAAPPLPPPPSMARRASADAYSSPVRNAVTAVQQQQQQQAAYDSPLRNATASPRTAAAAAAGGSGARASFDGQRPALPLPLPTPALRHRASDANAAAMAGRAAGIPSISVRGATPGVESPSKQSPIKVQRANSLRAGSGSEASKVVAASAAGHTTRPTSPMKDVPSRPGSSLGSRVPAPAPPTTITAAAAGAAIAIPSVANAEVQRFFQDLAAELASIKANGAGDGARTDRLQATLDHAVRNGGWLSPLTGASSPNPAHGGDFRFDDAEDDRSEAGSSSYRSGTDASAGGSPYTPTLPLAPLHPHHYDAAHIITPLGLAAPQDKARARSPIAPPVTGGASNALGFSPDRRGSSAMSTATASTLSTRSSTRRPTLAATLGRPASVFSNAPSIASATSSAASDTERIHAYLANSSRPGSALGHHAADKLGSVPYDSARRGPSPIAVDRTPGGSRATSTSSKLQSKNPGLGLDIHSALGVATVDNGLPSASHPSSHEMSSPRQASWFGSIFNFKPQVFLLYSIENHNVTLEVCKQLLQCFGCKVLVENSESSSPTLKCSVAEIRDATGRVVASKQVRFRVEFQTLSVASANASPALSPGLNANRLSVASPTLSSYSDASGRRAASLAPSTTASASVKVKITQEKGNASTLKACHALLREAWTLDKLESSPALSSNPYSPSI